MRGEKYRFSVETIRTSILHSNIEEYDSGNVYTDGVTGGGA